MYQEQLGKYRKKCERYNVPGHAHELTFGCYQGMPLFENKVFCEYFVEAVNKAENQYAFDVWAYVVMPEHIHLLLFPYHPPYSISDILRSIKQSVSRKAVNWLKDNQPDLLNQIVIQQPQKMYRFWQDGGGYDRNIFTREAAVNSAQYIHLNPVRRKLAETPDMWHYSSHNQSKGRVGPIEVNYRYFFKK
jgi:putative transposase